MKKYVFIAMMIFVGMGGGLAAPHRRGVRNECWADETYGSVDSSVKWGYYFCGQQDWRCDGAKARHWDKAFMQYHGDNFTFQTWPQEKYFCCWGSGTVEGKYIQADAGDLADGGSGFFVKAKDITEKKQVAGGTCNKLTRTDVCGEVHVFDCDTVSDCPDGTILRNKACVAMCEGDEVFESTTSNACIPCETNIHQGPSADHTTCIKCDRLREFFDRENHKCISKATQGLTQYAKEVLQECWKCPRELFFTCAKAIKDVNEAGLTGYSRTSAINSFAAELSGESLTNQCKLNQQ